MKGIILAGGKATRLYPLTLSISKQILPVYDKPMIYYPISILMLANIRDILIISTPSHLDLFKNLLGNGEDFGVNFFYKEQLEPKGIADAFVVGEDFIKNDDVALILGDNIVYGQNFEKILNDAVYKINDKKCDAIIFSTEVQKPTDYGIVELDNNKEILSLEEKPKEPKSLLAIIGLYLYNNNVVKIAKNIKPSARGEFEITSINQEYLKLKKISVINLDKNFTWFDMGSCDGIYEASSFVKNNMIKTNSMIACLEEIAFKKGWIDENNLEKTINKLKHTKYSDYLKQYLK